MEPLAPGTEDDPLYTQVVKLSKKEVAEEEALSKKAFLPNGKYDNIFELNYVQGAQHWFCQACECPIMGRLYIHQNGKRHMGNLEKWNKMEVPSKEGAMTSISGGSEVPIAVASGEPLPPGFEGDVEKTTLIQDSLDGFQVGPLVGLEYLLELLDYDPSKEPMYLCILCDKKGDPRTVLTHLSSYNHQITYLQKHFPTVYRYIAPFMIKQYKRNWQAGLQKIGEAIEATFGRLKPMQIAAGKFEQNRMQYIEIVAKGKHFNEISGHTFENVVSREYLTKVYKESKPSDSTFPLRNVVQQPAPKKKSPSPHIVARPIKKQKSSLDSNTKRKSPSPISDISSSDLEDFDPNYLGRSPKKETKASPKDKQGRQRSPIMRRRNPSPRRKEGPTPWQKPNYGPGKGVPFVEKRRDEKTEKIEEYKKLAKAIENDMEQILKKHKQNPEKHPKYNDEWKKFWNTRYKELQAEGKMAATHDFKPEWIGFWNKRMSFLHQQEIKNKKVALRKRLGLPEEPAPISFKIGEPRKPSEPGNRDNRPLPTAAQPENDPEVIVIDDDDRDSPCSRSPSRNRRWSRSPPRKRDRSPQFHRRSPVASPLTRRRGSPQRRSSPPRRASPSVRRVSPLSPNRRRSKDRARDGRLSPASLRVSPPRHSSSLRISPLSRREREVLRFSPPPSRRLSMERSPVPDRFRLRSRDKSRDRSRSRGRSREVSWERERDKHRDFDEKSWERMYRSRGAPWDYDYPHDSYEDEDDQVNIVAVLRHLTALEEKLGSLGPKVIELMGQALVMEKKAANSSEELLDSEINCVLFETVKEKLKGQLLVGFVDRIQANAFKTAIKKTASLIHLAGKRKKKREVELPKKPVVVPGVGTVDKGKIARQIANALIAQGKTDVTQDELEQLINAVVGIAEAQKNSSEPMTTASFLEKLASSGSLDEKRNVASKPVAKSKEKVIKESKETIQEIEEEQDFSNLSHEKGVMNMEGLSDSDLQTLLQNFKTLSTDEQHGLISYLKKLETKEPERVEKLRKFVNLTEKMDEKKETGRHSPFSNRLGSVNPSSQEVETENKEDKKSFANIDSEEEEYTFDDVAKAASQKVIEKEMELKKINDVTKRESDDKDMNNAKVLVSSLNKNCAAGINVPSAAEIKTNSEGRINIIANVPVSSADLAKSLSGISMSVSSLGSILGNIQNLTRQNQAQESKSSQKATLKSNNVPFSAGNLAADKPNPNDFDISSQKDMRGNSEFRPNDPEKNRANGTYDEFNIGRNSGEFREGMRDLGRGPNFGSDIDMRGPVQGFMNKLLGFPERGNLPSNLPLQDRMLPLDRNAPYDRNASYPQMGGFRGNSNQPGPSPQFSNQYPARGGGDFTLDRPNCRGGSGDFGPDRSDFRGRINEGRGEFSDFRGGPSEDLRGGSGDFRGGSDFRELAGNFSGAPEVVRGTSEPSRGGRLLKGGLPIDPNRLGNFRPPRYSENFRGNSNFNSSYKH